MTVVNLMDNLNSEADTNPFSLQFSGIFFFFSTEQKTAKFNTEKENIFCGARKWKRDLNAKKTFTLAAA